MNHESEQISFSLRRNLIIFFRFSALLFKACILATVLSSTTGWSTDKKVTQDNYSSLKKKISDEIKSGKVAGAAHLVVKGNNTLFEYVGGSRDIKDNTPMKSDTIVRIYSMTKPITSVAAMILYEKGKFKLSDPVSKFIPSFKNSKVMIKNEDEWIIIPPKREINIRDVFTHTTGYGYGDEGIRRFEREYKKYGMKYRNPAEMFPPDLSIKEAAEALARIPAMHHPGEKFTYGFSTDLLGRLIEVWSGQTLDVYLNESIFIPLGMSDTGFNVPRSKIERFSSCHTFKDGKITILDKSSKSPFVDGFKFLSGGGGLVSTLEDYSKFCRMIANYGKFNDRQILSKETMELIFTNHLTEIENEDPGDFQFGLGFAIGEETFDRENTPLRAKRYSWGGYASTEFHIVPSRKFYQIFLRQTIPMKSKLARELFQEVYKMTVIPD